MTWSSTWPTEPGWYWTWDPGEDGWPDRMEPACVTRQFGSTGYGMNGIAIYQRDYPDMLWGPRIEAPEPPSRGA